MKILFVNPHIHDFVYSPLSYILFGRKALTKYAYLDKIFCNSLYFFKGSLDSSAPSRISSKIPKKIFLVISKIERYLWEILNNKKLKNINENNLIQSNLFLFGYKISKTFLDYLIKNNFRNKIFIHISHYHTYEIPSKYFSKLNIKLCFDNDVIGNNFFKSKFPNYKGNLIMLPFEVKKKFFINNKLKKISRIVSTGTYHKSIGVNGINYKGFSTLHPIRLYISMKDIKCKHFINLMTLYNPSKLINVIIGQKKYMSIDIVSEYQKSSHSFVGCEGTGAIAIGTLESMACGCIPFLSKDEIKGLLFDPQDAEFITYDSEDELYEKIISFNSDIQFKFSYKNSNLARLYLNENLVEVAKRNLEIY